MATYVLTGQTSYGGPWAATIAECNINAGNFRPAKAKFIAEQINLGNIVSGDRVLLNASIGGPLKLIDAQDWPVSSVALATRISGSVSGPLNIPIDGSVGRNIVFGNVSRQAGDSPSSANGIAFHATGTDGWNVDMTGVQASGNLQNRQMAAIIIQGQDLDVTGWRIKCADWNFIATSRIAAPSATSYAGAASYENCGLFVRGAWGSRIYANVVEGNGYTNIGLEVAYSCWNADSTINQGKSVLVYQNTTSLCGEVNLYVIPAWGTTQEILPYNALVDVFENTSFDAAFYSSGSSANNAALIHANLISVKAAASPTSRVRVYRNTAYGNCQDAIVTPAVGVESYDNNISAICPTFTGAQAITPLLGNAAGSTAGGFASGWDFRANNIEGNGIKLGLGGFDGTGGSNWLVPGTPGGSYAVDELRNRTFRNRVIDVTGYCISANGSAGMVIFGNECDNSTRGAGTNHCFAFANRTNIGNHWVAHNYMKGPSTGLLVGNNNRLFMFNNAIDAPSNIGQISATGSQVFGANNVTRAAAWSVSPGSVFTTGGIVATPAYTIGVGPTAGGNCDGFGEINGILGARTPSATARPLSGNWNVSRLPIGPRQP